MMRSGWSLSHEGSRNVVHRIFCIAPGHTELDLATAPELSRQLLDLEAPAEVLLDMSQVAFCDAAGIRALLDGWNHQWASGGTMQLCGTQPYVHHILTLAGAVHVFARSAERPALATASDASDPPTPISR